MQGPYPCNDYAKGPPPTTSQPCLGVSGKRKRDAFSLLTLALQRDGLRSRNQGEKQFFGLGRPKSHLRVVQLELALTLTREASQRTKEGRAGTQSLSKSKSTVKPTLAVVCPLLQSSARVVKLEY